MHHEFGVPAFIPKPPQMLVIHTRPPPSHLEEGTRLSRTMQIQNKLCHLNKSTNTPGGRQSWTTCSHGDQKQALSFAALSTLGYHFQSLHLFE